MDLTKTILEVEGMSEEKATRVQSCLLGFSRLTASSQLDYVDFKFISLPLAIVRIDCTIVRVIEPQRLLVVLRNGI